MITQTAEYALRAMVYLADRDGAPRTNAQIAEATEIPAGYLAKVMQSLSRARLVHSRRGLNGGFTLAKDIKELTILEIVDVVDPIRRFPECPLGIASHGKTLCPLHRRLDDAGAMVEESFAHTTLADLLDVPRQRKPLCRFPCLPEAATNSR
ncbi:MAG: Rrf2 family transcriptional regulator [Planctomycetales bacterium]|nr:Rrf2 family transcriptional regulator [Planctomycetales bacterium]